MIKMRIKEMYIYGYGKLTDLHISSFSSFQVIYGENEAGKSTMMAFIHGVLFGFPTKQQSELRYEPKNHLKYGGKLVIETNADGDVTIERTKGKAAGDVTVTLANGTVGGDDLLSKILNGLDKRMYQAIFSFNVHGLQDVGRMKGEDISKYLLAAGTFGTDTIMDAEQQLQKELDTLFKPNGRKPELNQMLDKLKEKDLDLKKGKQHNESYNLLQHQSWQLQEDIEQLQNQIHNGQKTIQKLDQRIHEWPLYQERKQTTNRIKQLGEIPFPIDGLNRLEHIEDQLRSVTSYLTTIKERKSLLENQLEAVIPNPLIIENESQIQQAIEQWPQALDWQEQMMKWKFEVETIDEEIKKLQRDIHYSEEDLDQLAHIDIGIDMKENVRNATKDYFYLCSGEKELTKQEEWERKSLTEVEKSVCAIEEKLVSEEEFRALSENQKQFKMIQQLQSEYKHVQEQIQTIKMARGYQQSKVGDVRTIILTLLLLCLMVYSLITKQTLLAGGTLLGIIFLVFSYWNEKRSKVNNSSEISSFLEREKKLSFQLEHFQKYEDQSERFEEQQNLRQEWKELILLLEKQQSRYASVKESLQNWKLEWNANMESLRKIKNQLQLYPGFSPEQLTEAFEILSELIKVLKRKEGAVRSKEILKEKYGQWLSKVEELNALLNYNKMTIDESIIRLKNEWKTAQAKQNQYRELTIKLEDLKNDELKWMNEKVTLVNVIEELLTEANAENKEDFRIKSRKYDELQVLRSNLVIIEKKLNHEDISDITLGESLIELEEARNKQQDELQMNSSKLDIFHKKLAQINYEISVLEEGGTYTEKLHDFYYLKDMYNNKAKQWAKISIAKQILKMTMDRLKNERFPKVIEKAEEYLSFLTNQEYNRLHLQEDGKFIVERKDKTIFFPVELSQATAEQLYIAFRFALVQVLKPEYSLPLIIDDSFVNFDKQRTTKVFELLKAMSKTTQILYFTCHQHLLSVFSTDQILELSTENANVEVFG
jgi:uncharacterized protein YhaN